MNLDNNDTGVINAISYRGGIYLMLTKLKFNEDGTMKWFPGNTIVSNLYDDEKLMEAIKRIQREYRQLPFSYKYSLTPEESIHMTVFELLCHFNRKPEYWSSQLELDEDLEKLDTYFYDKLSSIKFPSGFEMQPARISGTNIEVNPVDENTRKLLKDLREQLAEVTGVRFPNHDTYQFHISFGYRIHDLTEEEEQEIKKLNETLNKEVVSKIGAITIKEVSYTVFEDMSKFVPYNPGARMQLRVEKGYK